jgi:hypothetical protein
MGQSHPLRLFEKHSFEMKEKKLEEKSIQASEREND